MQLFLFLNDLAGRWPLLDGLMRGIYIGTLPLLGTLLLGHLLLGTRAQTTPSRGKIAFATLSSIALIALVMMSVGWISESLGLGTLSPRPFMTRWVNLLVVEPQDNSFPSPEIMIAAALCIALGTLGRRPFLIGATLTVLLGIARLFCGTNYGADVLVGALLGAAIGAISLAAWRAPLPHIARPTLAALGTATLGFTLLGVYVALAAEPRFSAKLHTPWGTPASAASEEQTPRSGSTRASRSVGEGEGYASDGAASLNDAEALALSKRSHLFLPEVETYLKGKLTPLARPFPLLDVEVAPVTVDGEATRCAALRFEVPANAPNARRQVSEIAARLVKTAFALDKQLQNVDVTAIARGQAPELDGSQMRFVGDEVPVFTASIQRKNLILQAPRWANAPNLDGGSWLRTRSRLYVNDKVLPPAPGSQLEPVPMPAQNSSSTMPVPIIKATPKPVPKPKKPLRASSTKPVANNWRRSLPPSPPLP